MQFVLHVSLLAVADENVLLVQEGKDAVQGLWNLPGGHVEPGEDILRAAEREFREETGMLASVQHLLGIYTGIGRDHYLHIVFTGRILDGILRPGAPEILDCRWFPVEDVLMMDNALLLNPRKLRCILDHYRQGRLYPPELLFTHA